MIKKIKLFVNHNDQSMRLAKLVKEGAIKFEKPIDSNELQP